MGLPKSKLIAIILIMVFIGSSLFIMSNITFYRKNKTAQTDFQDNINSMNIDQLEFVEQEEFSIRGQNETDALLSYRGAALLESDTENDIEIKTNEWNASDILVNFTDIHTFESPINVEDQTFPIGFLTIFDNSMGSSQNYYAMQFVVPDDCFMFYLSVYLRYAGNISLKARIYNSVIGISNPVPRDLQDGYVAISETKNLTTYGGENKTEWVEFQFKPRIYKAYLDAGWTEAYSFFVVLIVDSFGSYGNESFLEWAYLKDSVNGDDGNAYQYVGNAWQLIQEEGSGIDLLLTNVTISVQTWQDTFNVENDSPSDFVLVYDEDRGIGGVLQTQDNAMQFTTTTMSYLADLSVYIKYKGRVIVYAEIYNATESGSSNPGQPIPDKLLFASKSVELTSLTKEIMTWVPLFFPEPNAGVSTFLNLFNTFDNTFFVVVRAYGLGSILKEYVYWGYVGDSEDGDNGFAYYWDSGMAPEYWTLFENHNDVGDNIDLLLRNVRLVSYEQKPSDLSLKVNGSNVNDYNTYDFGGSIFITGDFTGSSGIILLDVTGNQKSYFTAKWTTLFTNQTKATTHYEGKSLSTTIDWNVTLYTNFPKWTPNGELFGRYFAREVNITFPKSHQINQVEYLGTPLSSGYFWVVYQSEKYQILVIHNFSIFFPFYGTGGQWRVQATSPNFVQEIHTYNGTNEVTKFYVGDAINVTAILQSNTTVQANLTIYNTTKQVVNTSLKTPIGTWVDFSPWVVTENGTHHIVVRWTNGTEVGIKSLSVMCVYHTNLSVVYTNIGPTPFDPKDKIYIDVFYNDTDNNAGIPGATITVNVTYTVQEHTVPGYYNITLQPYLLENGNYTARIRASRPGYNMSDVYVKFSVFRSANATLNVTDGCRYVNGIWWVDPAPYFDDQTHTITVFYANGTPPYEGIEYAQVIAEPNWTSVNWYGNPKNLTPGFYDIQIDTEGLHEGDTGKLKITAYSENFETKVIWIYLIVVEIPTSLLYIDAGEYSNITAYEGETISIAMGYWDDFHDLPILFNNLTEGNLTWQIAGTTANGILEKSVWQYETTISLPEWNILGTRMYNITITAVALRDYATYQTNLTLNVLSKENTTLTISNSTPTEYRIGHSFYIYANLTLENGTALFDQKVDFNISLWNQGQLKSYFVESRFTNQEGIATYYYPQIQEGIDQIQINVTYDGTAQIDPASGFQIIPILPKYGVTLLLNTTAVGEYRVGQDMYFLATLLLENGTHLNNYKIAFNITFYENSEPRGQILETRLTNSSGIATFYLAEIPQAINQLMFEAIFVETETIQGASKSTNIQIGPKYQPVITILSSLPGSVMVGDSLEIEALLKNNDTQEGMSNETLEFILIFNNNEKIIRKATTDSEGHALVQIEISSDYASADSFTIIVRYEETKTSNSAILDTQVAIEIMTWSKIILGILPYIGIAIAAVVGSYLSYRQFVALPRRRRRLARMEKLASKFTDIVNLQHLLVIHAKTGSCLFQYSFGETTLDADLISGFLTAISAFQTEITTAPPSSEKIPFADKKLSEEPEEVKEQGFELSYANFKILLKDGEKIRTALILAAQPTESIRESLDEFVKQFEIKYEDELKDWRGAISPFHTADAIIELAFETSLLWPHIVEKEVREKVKLNSLEDSLVTLALTIQQEKQYFFLPTLVGMAENVRRESRVEILGTIDDLRQKGLFRAIPIEVLSDLIQQSRNNQNTESEN